MPVDATDPTKRVMPMMTDADMAMKVDPAYRAICEKFMADPAYFRRLLRTPRLVQADPPRPRPAQRYIGPDAPQEDLIWQDPVPAGTHRLRCGGREGADRGIGPVRSPTWFATAWDSARTFRPVGPARRCQTARGIRLAPAEGLGRQRARAPGARTCRCWTADRGGKPAYRLPTSIVLAGNVGVWSRPQRPPASTSPCRSSRVAATRRTRMTDAESFLGAGAAGRWLSKLAQGPITSSAPKELMLDRTQLLGLTGTGGR